MTVNESMEKKRRSVLLKCKGKSHLKKRKTGSENNFFALPSTAGIDKIAVKKALKMI